MLWVESVNLTFIPHHETYHQSHIYKVVHVHTPKCGKFARRKSPKQKLEETSFSRLHLKKERENFEKHRTVKQK